MRPDRRRELTDRQFGWIALGLGLLALSIAGLAVLSSMPIAAVRLPGPPEEAAQVLLPEGWAFFTANPEAVYPQAYVRSADGSWLYQNGSLARPSELFGLDRARRVTSAEIDILLRGVPGRAWRACGSLPARCLSLAPDAVRLVNRSPDVGLCGEVGFVRQQVLPWAWRDTEVVMPSTVVRAEVSCPSSG